MNTTASAHAPNWSEQLGELVAEVADAITEDAVRQGSEPGAARAAFLSAMIAECLDLGDNPSQLVAALWGPLSDRRLGGTAGRA